MCNDHANDIEWKSQPAWASRTERKRLRRARMARIAMATGTASRGPWLGAENAESDTGAARDRVARAASASAPRLQRSGRLSRESGQMTMYTEKPVRRVLARYVQRQLFDLFSDSFSPAPQADSGPGGRGHAPRQVYCLVSRA